MAYVGACVQVLIGLLAVVVSVAANALMAGLGSATGLPVGTGLTFVLLLVVGVVSVLNGVAVGVLGIFTQRGKNGARIGLTVVGGLNVLLFFVNIASGSSLAIISVAYVVTGVVLLWVGRANAWFAHVKATAR